MSFREMDPEDRRKIDEYIAKNGVERFGIFESSNQIIAHSAWGSKGRKKKKKDLGLPSQLESLEALCVDSKEALELEEMNHIVNDYD